MLGVSLSEVLLGCIFLVSLLALVGTVLGLRSSRRSEALGENRYELLRDQWERMELLRDERRTLVDELERQSRERQQLMEFLGKTPSQLVENLTETRREHLEARERIEYLEQERLRLEQGLHQYGEQLTREQEAHLEAQRRSEQMERREKEHSDIQQEMERLGDEYRRLLGDLETEREERLRAERRADGQEQERARLEEELRSARSKLDGWQREPVLNPVNESEASRAWWRRSVLVISLFVVALALWIISLMAALYVLSP